MLLETSFKSNSEMELLLNHMKRYTLEHSGRISHGSVVARVFVEARRFIEHNSPG